MISGSHASAMPSASRSGPVRHGSVWPAGSSVTVLTLLDGSGSAVVDEIVAVLDQGPGPCKMTSTVTVADPPLAMSPSAQVTVVVPVQLPVGATAERTNESTASGSVTCTLCAGFGPALVMVSVYSTGSPACPCVTLIVFAIRRSALLF